MVTTADQYDIIIPSGNRFLSSPFQMTTKHDQLAEKIANIDLFKKPENAHEERMQDLKRLLLKAEYLDDED